MAQLYLFLNKFLFVLFYTVNKINTILLNRPLSKVETGLNFYYKIMNCL